MNVFEKRVLLNIDEKGDIFILFNRLFTVLACFFLFRGATLFARCVLRLRGCHFNACLSAFGECLLTEM